jgi:hypothetical protein
MFKYDLFSRREMDATTSSKGRIYNTPIGPLRSVTTILGAKLKSKKLEEWRIAVGHVKADADLEQGRRRGNSVHEACEHYLQSGYLTREHSIMMPSTLALFLEVKPILDKHITKIYGVEFPLYSEELRTAGRADGLVEWLNHNVVLDFKTCRKSLKQDDDRIFKYNIQATTYAMMTEEMYKVEFPYNVVVVIPNNDYPQIIIKTNAKYRNIVRELFNDK